jgi:hypothetical protein
MIETLIIAIPGLVALIVCILRGPELALLDVYLPVLLLLPEYHWPISGQFSFTDTAILPIAAFLLFRSKLKWRCNITDFLVIAYIAITVVAEGMNKGYKEGSQNLALQELTSILLPYLVAKQMFQQPHFAVDFAKRIAVLLIIVSIVSVYEFRMSSDLFTRLFDPIFPPTGNTFVSRGGFKRVEGPYGHAIALGWMMAFGFRIARWLEWNGVWRDRMRFLPISKIRFCEFWIAAGSIMSLSLGPWLGAACGAVVVSVFRAHNRKRAVVSLVLLIAFVGAPIYGRFNAYVSVDPRVAHKSGDQLQEDAAYRTKLIPLYTPLVEERPTWGWGRNGVPALEGMKSIDNDYLLVALTFGLYALYLRVALFVWPAIRSGIFSLPLSHSDSRALAAFCIIGICVINVVIARTVSAGGAPLLFVFIITGWSSALLDAKSPEIATTPDIARIDAGRSSPRTQLGFRRVMV